MNTYTNPPQQAQGHDYAKAPRSATSTAILIATSVVGGLALIGTASSAAFGMWVAESWEVVEQSGDVPGYGGDGEAFELYADAVGVTSIEIDVAASDFTIEYDDVVEAVLTVDNGGQWEGDQGAGWTLERTDDELTVKREGSRRAGDLCVFGCGLGGDQSVTLTLPIELGENRAASLDVEIAAGKFTSTGSFDEVSATVDAGALTLKGDARTLDLEVSFGDATVELADVDEVEAAVATGNSTVTLTGAAPRSVNLRAEMGSLTAQLPEESYLVDAKAELGSIDNRLETNKDSKYVVKVRAEAAEVTLKH